ncbi:PIN domain-containing protein [Arthrobacter sp. ISL-28]|uniref:PIN domain-containing protein n=1 Tax=Arthrobacter sp. ISL-28 TaxID=2819108 RepID=UPI001BEBF99D|nr:PIN domain-containing protein [Arthrobacter sp. ISL-28]MBT2520918.1 PIN domain-containing protein [Arthrobacter sp. ISL-28]
MVFTVIYDANVLYPSMLRDLLIRVAQAGLVQARWTETILDETFRNLKNNRPDLDPAKLDRTRTLMCAAVADCLVTGYEPLEQVFANLPDPGDAHVMAAALKVHAQVIVTNNLKHFPEETLTPWGMEAKHPDDFLMDQFHLDAVELHVAIRNISEACRNPPLDVNDVLDRLDLEGMPQIAAALRR